MPAIFICSGERDAMNVASMGYVPVWLNSESADLSMSTLIELHRLAMGDLWLPEDLQVGQCRELTEEELKLLQQL